MLEHPAEAFSYYRNNGVQQVICEEKHMGSRAVVVICKDETVAKSRFGIVDAGIGSVYTRTGRRFFEDEALETAFLERVRDSISNAGLWDELSTDWMLLDCELMPWSAKAQELLQRQYAAVGSSASASFADALHLLGQVQKPETMGLLEKFQKRQSNIQDYIAAYRHYCWPVNTLDDLKLAPFHLLASEGAVHADKPHSWHMETLSRLAQTDSVLLMATPYQVVDTTDEASVQAGIDWWLEMTGKGGEGMVVKPMDFIVHGSKELVQPAIKIRGREYLRIIYGAEYTEHIERLKKRGLAQKRSLALREFALGIEAIERFVRHEPLRKVHEAVFGVLALESEPIDPRL
jgi:protein phosphatase